MKGSQYEIVAISPSFCPGLYYLPHTKIKLKTPIFPYTPPLWLHGERKVSENGEL